MKSLLARMSLVATLVGSLISVAGAGDALGSPLGAGSLDLSFGTGGKVMLEAGFGSLAYDAVVRPDDRIVMSGGALGTFTLAALLPNGARDRSFGGGIVHTVFNKVGAAVSTGLALQGDASVVAVGTVQTYPTPFRIGLARYLPNGSLDPAFGDRGRVITRIGDSYPYPYGVAIQPDGRIIVVGQDCGDVLLLRYLSDGTLDASFGDGGVVLTDLGGSDYGFDVTAGADGGIAVAGSTSVDGGDFLVLRYDADGHLDETFGDQGVVITQFPTGASSASALDILRDGRIVVAGGATAAGMAAARYDPSGTLDPTFNGDGLFADTRGGGAASVALQPDGGTVLTGLVGPRLTRGFALIRLDSTGAVDPHFGRDGLAYVSFGVPYSSATACVVQSDGKLVVTGISGRGQRDYDFAAARFVGRP
jgi:uncharacterized delta-60 repeat protein